MEFKVGVSGWVLKNREEKIEIKTTTKEIFEYDADGSIAIGLTFLEYQKEIVNFLKNATNLEISRTEDLCDAKSHVIKVVEQFPIMDFVCYQEQKTIDGVTEFTIMISLKPLGELN